MVGGLNWLLVGLFNQDIFMMIGWEGNIIAKIVYILVGLSALYLLFTHKATCKLCDKGMSGGAPKMGM